MSTISGSRGVLASIRAALTQMNMFPEKLEMRPATKMAELQAMLKSTGQSSANEVKPHEACIAEILDANGFRLVDSKTTPTESGLYYMYQIGGSQRSGDFKVFEIQNGVETFGLVLDAKHSSSMSIYLNDGSFELNTVYIVSFTKTTDKLPGERKKQRQHVCMIGLGQDIMTEKDRTKLERRRAILAELNKEAEDVDFLRLYARSANQYSCKQFTPEFVTDRLAKTLASIQPSSEQIVEALHSLSVSEHRPASPQMSE